MVLGVAAAASIGTCVLIQSHVDREAPELIIGSILQGVTADVTDEDLLVDVTAKDKRDGDLTDQVMVAERTLGEEEMEVVYAVTDAAGNVALKRRAIPLTEEMIFADGATRTEEETATETETEEESTETEESTEESSEIESMEETEESESSQADTSEEESIPETNSPEESVAPETMPEETSTETPEESSIEETTEETEPVETADPAIPVVRLKQNTVTLPAGTPFEYASYIESVTDDKDDQYQLYQHLVVTGFYDVRTPGSYPLQYWVTDTDRHESERQEFLLIIE